MSFVTDDEKIYEKYSKIWEVIRKLLKVNFAVSPVRDNKYLVAKLDKIDKRAYPQTYLEQCKYKLKKRKIVDYIDDEIIDENSDIDDAIDRYVVM